MECGGERVGMIEGNEGGYNLPNSIYDMCGTKPSEATESWPHTKGQ